MHSHQHLLSPHPSLQVLETAIAEARADAAAEQARVVAARVQQAQGLQAQMATNATARQVTNPPNLCEEFFHPICLSLQTAREAEVALDAAIALGHQRTMDRTVAVLSASGLLR